MMKYTKLVVILMILVLFSFHFASPTLSRFSSEYSGSDETVIAKWNFRVGSDSDNLHNQGFTFDIFGGQKLEPQGMGKNSFVISAGESDVAIDYEVCMNIDVLMKDIIISNGQIDYPPLIFKIESEKDEPTVNSKATITSPYGIWFDLNDIDTDEDGYFQVATGKFEAGSDEIAEITIDWWWNTSFYVGESGRYNIDSSLDGNYYQLATNVYEALEEDWIEKDNEVDNFLEIHERIVTSINGEDEVSYNWHGTSSDTCPITDAVSGVNIDTAHKSAYNVLATQLNDLREQINNSLKVKYDYYDTKALIILNDLQPDSTEHIMFRVVGEQVTPGQM